MPSRKPVKVLPAVATLEADDREPAPTAIEAPRAPDRTPLRGFDPIPPLDLSDEATRLAIDRAQAGEPLGGPDMTAIFRIKRAQYHNLAKAGAFDAFLLKPAIGSKRYSGVKVYRYLCGDPVYEPTFGRKRRA